MERLNKFYFGILIISIMFAVWGLARWLQAQAFAPETPVPDAAGRYTFRHPQRQLPLSRYAPLQKGELFFGPQLELPSSGEPVKVKVEFSSKLLLYGVTKGITSDADRAIVGLTGDVDKQTWLVKVGSVVDGETVVKLEEKGIWVKNGSGKGKVELKKE
jgi:hypothetical protein